MANKSYVISYVIRARDAFSKATEKANQSLAKFQKRIQLTKQSMADFGAKMRNIGIGMSAAITAPIALIAKNLKDLSRDAIETESKFEAVFGGISKSANKGAADLAKNYGLAKDEAKKFLSDTGDLLTGFGFAQDKAFEMSMLANELAGDLGSFQNVDSAQASKAITSALLGEREMMKSLGVVILEEDVKAKMLIQRKEGLRFATERQAKAQATMALILEQTKNAQGDYARTSKGLANQEKQTAAKIRDLKVSFGKLLIPTMLKANEIIQSMTSWLSGLTDSQKKTALAVSLVAAVIGPLLVVFGGLMAMLPAMAAGFALVSGAILPIVAIGAAAYLIYKNWGKISEYLSGTMSGLMSTISGLWQSVKGLFDLLYKALQPVLALIGKMFATILVAQIKLFVAILKPVIATISFIIKVITALGIIIKVVGKYLIDLMAYKTAEWIKPLQQWASDFWQSITKIYDKVAAFFEMNSPQWLKDMAGVIGGVFDSVKSSASGVADYLSFDVNAVLSKDDKQWKETLKGFANKFSGSFDGVPDKIASLLSPLAAIKNLVKSFLNHKGASWIGSLKEWANSFIQPVVDIHKQVFGLLSYAGASWTASLNEWANSFKQYVAEIYDKVTAFFSLNSPQWLVDMASWLSSIFTKVTSIADKIASLFSFKMPDWLSGFSSLGGTAKVEQSSVAASQAISNQSVSSIANTYETINNHSINNNNIVDNKNNNIINNRNNAINNGITNQQASLAPLDVGGASKVNVGVNVGLDKGLKQTSKPQVRQRGARAGNVGAMVGAT